jgi:hypothetical protein
MQCDRLSAETASLRDWLSKLKARTAWVFVEPNYWESRSGNLFNSRAHSVGSSVASCASSTSFIRVRRIALHRIFLQIMTPRPVPAHSSNELFLSLQPIVQSVSVAFSSLCVEVVRSHADMLFQSRGTQLT